MPPSSIGPYTITRELGRGGMGVVFLAHDTRLDRQVAIKALPDPLVNDADRLSRFQREAKVLASLNHSGIAAIYGLEHAESQQYLVLEYVDGETLDVRLARGPLPVDESLDISRRIAEALEAAHDKGVIHRDLKPGNVMITPDGAVKVLDFGIARAADGTPGPSMSPGIAQADSPTIQSPAPMHSPTIPGAIMGTAGYMSPEQALGKVVDKRADIFALGCVLYEMLTGAQAFPGENATASIAAVLHLDPEWTSLPANAPARIRELLASMLEKDRKQRLHDIADARLALERAIDSREWTSAGRQISSTTPRSSLVRALPWVLTAACFVLAAAVWRPWRSPDRSPIDSLGSAPLHLRVDSPDAPPGSAYDNGMLAITTDGMQVAYITPRAGTDSVIAVRRMNDSANRRLSFPFLDLGMGPVPPDMMFSPDGKAIAALSSSTLYLIPVVGGEPTRLYRGPRYVATKGCAWFDKGIIFSPAPNTGLMLVSDKGGDPETLTVPDAARDELSHRWPDVLPDGRHALITVKKSDILTFDDAEIALLDLDTRTWKTIIEGGTYARYASSGHIVFARNGSIMAVPFDAAAGAVTGAPVAVVNGVMTSPGSGAAQFAIARDSGTLVYIPGGSHEVQRDLVWIDFDGTIEPIGAPFMAYEMAAVSPDGSRIATLVYGASDAIFVYDLAKRTNMRITFRGNSSNPMWTSDGSKIAYISDAGGPISLYLVNADGSGNPQAVMGGGAREYGSMVMAEGKTGAVFTDAGDVWLQFIDEPSPRKLVESQFDETQARTSPDGRWLSYASDNSGQYEVYVRPFPSGEGRWQVSIGGGRMHRWASDGRSILYVRDGDIAVLRTSFRTDPTVEVGQPELMFTLPVGTGAYESFPGGTRLVGIRTLPSKFAVSEVRAVLNWFDVLKAKVPTRSR